MSWSLFDVDALTGRKIWMSLDEAPPGKTLWRIEVPADALLEANAEAEKASMNQRFGEWNRIASIPHNIMESVGLDTAVRARDDRFLSRWLNDSDHSKFRTSRGRV